VLPFLLRRCRPRVSSPRRIEGATSTSRQNQGLAPLGRGILFCPAEPTHCVPVASEVAGSADEMVKDAPKIEKQKTGKPRPADKAPSGAMKADRSPEPENKHAKRTATKQRLTKKGDR
jgi:hypothetical protein